MRLSRLGITAALVTGAAMVALSASGRLSTVVVSGNTAAFENDPGWMFNRDPANATPIAFSLDAASTGIGSLYVLPLAATPSAKFIGELFLHAQMADVLSISYDFQMGSGANPTKEEQYYANVYANFGGQDPSLPPNFGHCVYSVVPTAGSTTNFTTVTFDPSQPYPVRRRTATACPSVPAAMGAGATLRAFSINLGDTTAGDAGFDGYFDNVVVTTTAGTVAYDFEPTPQTANDCKAGGWKTFGFRNQGQCMQFVNTGK